MALKEQILRYFSGAARELDLTYEQLSALNFDVGIRLDREGEIERRVLTRPIVVTAQRFERDGLSVVVFSGTSPVVLRFPAAEVKPATQDYVQLRYVLEGNLLVGLEDEEACFGRSEACLLGSNVTYREVVRDIEGLVLNVNISQDVLGESFLGEITQSPVKAFLRSGMLHVMETHPYLRFSPQTAEWKFRGGDAEFARLHPDEVVENNLVESGLSFLFGEAHYQASGHQDVMRGHAIRLLDRLSLYCRSELAVQDRDAYDDALFQTVDQYLREHIDSVTLTELSHEFHYHPNYFGSLVKRHTGIPFSAYLIRLRLDVAKHLLRETDLPVDQIAAFVGYNNRGFFYRKFEDDTGMKPAAWRARMKMA